MAVPCSALTLLAMAGVAGAWPARAADPSPPALLVPAISGELGGDFQMLSIAGAPALHWKFSAEHAEGNRRTATFTADGDGTKVVLSIETDEAGHATWRVADSRIALKNWLGGQLIHGSARVAGQGTMSAAGISGDLTVELTDADLGEIAAFADAEKKYVRTASGKVGGTIGIRWRAGKIHAGDSQLGLAKGTVATVTFVPSPGLLTSYVPAQVLKAYPGIEAIEMGRTPLEAKVLSLVFHPDGDEQGRGARLRIEGRPLDPKIIAPIELDVNFTGPLESVVRTVLDSRLKVRK
jgi:hypothetical protein